MLRPVIAATVLGAAVGFLLAASVLFARADGPTRQSMAALPAYLSHRLFVVLRCLALFSCIITLYALLPL